MAIKHCGSFLLAFLAPSIILLASQAKANDDLCNVTDYKPLCRAAVKGITNPPAAIEAAINQAILETQHAKVLAGRQGKNQNTDVCNEEYDDAINNLQKSIKNLKDNDEGALNSNLSAAINDYVTCGDAYEEGGEVSPLADVNKTLQEMVDNCLSLVTLIHH